MSKKGLVPADKKLGKALVRAAQKYEAQIKSSSDGLVNVVSGLGTQKAKRADGSNISIFEGGVAFSGACAVD